MSIRSKTTPASCHYIVILSIAPLFCSYIIGDFIRTFNYLVREIWGQYTETTSLGVRVGMG